MATQILRKDFVEEMITKAVIDTAYIKTVMGQLKLQSYMKNLEDTLLNQVEISESHKVCKFGVTVAKLLQLQKQNYDHK